MVRLNHPVFSFVRRETEALARRSYLSRGGYTYFPPRGRRVVDMGALLELYLSDAVIQRAVHKRSRDLFGGGFVIEGVEEGLCEYIMQFLENRIHYKRVFADAARDSFVYGNGFREKVYSNDSAPSDEPTNGDELVELAPVSPRQVTVVEDDDVDSYTYGKVVGYYVIPPVPHSVFAWQPILIIPKSKLGVLPEGRMIHPSRIIHMKFNSLSDSNIGISLLEPAYNILKSKIETDKVLGTIMVRFAKPLIKAIIENGTQDEIRHLSKQLFNMNKRAEDISFLVTDDAVKELSAIGASGHTINPAEYYDIMLKNICIGFGIPKALLVGSEAGSISGSDLNLVAYIQSLKSDQETVQTPLILDLIESYLATQNLAMPPEIRVKWTQEYSDELAMFKSTFMNTQSAVTLFGATIITKNEARKMVNLDPVVNGDVFNDVAKIRPSGFGDVSSIVPEESPKRSPKRR